MNSRPIPIRLEETLIERIDRMALTLGIKRSSLIKLAINVQMPQLEGGRLDVSSVVNSPEVPNDL